MKLGLVCLSVALAGVVPAAEFWVDQNAAAGGNGSSGAPFQTINDGVNAAAAGDTVSVRNGVYRECINLKSGKPGQPFTLRTAPGSDGTNVVISGFRTIGGWQPYSGSIYTTTVDIDARDLFVGYKPQMIARDRNRDQQWHRIETIGSGGTVFSVTNNPLGAVSGTNSFIFGIESTGDIERMLRVAGVNPSGGTVTLTAADTRFQAGNPFILCNDVALIDEPGEWSYEPLASGGTRLYFWPEQVSDLQQTQSGDPTLSGQLILYGDSHVVIKGFEIAGSSALYYAGVRAYNKSRDITISDCVIHDCRYTGISIRDCSDVKISRCVVLRADHGIGLSGVHNGIVEDCEVAFCYADGINVTGDPGHADPEYRVSDQVVLRRNYIHHNIYLEHPDSMQIYTGVHRFGVEDTLSLFGGQGLMTETCDTDLFIRNSVFWGTGANNFQCHADSKNWALWNNTFGMAGWFQDAMAGEEYRCYENIIYGGPHNPGVQYQGDRNIIWRAGRGSRVIQPWNYTVLATGYSTIAAFTTATGQDANSLEVDPLLANVPLAQGYIVRNDSATLSSQKIGATPDGSSLLDLSAGDLIEINGDGVARTVTGISNGLVSFTPALPAQQFRASIVWHWATSDFQLDVTPSATGPAAGMSIRNPAIGSTLVVSNYQAGDFNGDGTRDLPAIPPALLAAWPDPNNPVIPYVSPF